MFAFTVYDLLAKNLGDRAGHPAVELGDTVVTYGELARRAEALAAWLADAGVRRGDRVGIHLRKSIEEIVATFAIARLGAVFVNVNYQWKLRQLRHIVADCGIRVLITDRRRARTLVCEGPIDALDGVLAVNGAVDHPKVSSWRHVPADAVAPQVRCIDADLAALLYTSGSTGMPKGVMLSHMNLLQEARTTACQVANQPADRVLALLSLSFDYGLNQVTTMFLVGGTVVVPEALMAAEIAATIREKHVSGMGAVPPTWVQFVHYLEEARMSLPELRYITSSGGQVPRPILEAMPRVFPKARIFLMYGTTEAFRSTYLPPELFHKKRGAIGVASPNVEVFVVDPRKGICGPGERGELLHRGSLVSQGYWGRPDDTAACFKPCPHLRDLIGNERVFHTGDIVDIDEDGILWFVARSAAFIKCSGQRVSPTEVEEIVFDSGLVEHVVAFGVKNESLDEIVHVAVSPLGKGQFDSVALLAHCRKNMPRYMMPGKVHVCDGPMPRTSSGKLDRPAVIRSCTGQV